MGADWSIIIGVLVFIIAIIFAIISYVKHKKIYQILYILSVSTYIFAIFYTWDIFELTKNLVLIMLLISTILMLSVAKYFSYTKVFKK